MSTEGILRLYWNCLRWGQLRLFHSGGRHGDLVALFRNMGVQHFRRVALHLENLADPLANVFMPPFIEHYNGGARAAQRAAQQARYA